MKNLCLLLFGFLLGVPSALAQRLQLAPQPASIFEADRLAGYDKFGFYYGIKDDAFFKYKDGRSIEYKNVSLGKISRVDLQNQLRIVLFYEAFNTAVLLDNQLTETQKIDFSQSNPPVVVTATAMASQNRLWIYDSLSQRIGLWEYLKGTYLLITPPLQGGIVQYGADFNYFQWIDGQHNWYRCDAFGKISLVAKAPEFDAASLSDEALVFSKGGRLYLFAPKTNQQYPLEILDKTFASFFLKEHILTIFTGHSITNYKITIP